MLTITDAMLAGLMKSKYYTTVFLPETMHILSIQGDFITPLYLFSALCIPYSNAEYMAFLNPKYATQLAGNTLVKDVLRTVLVLPGLPMTLFWYLLQVWVVWWNSANGIPTPTQTPS